MAYVCMWLMLPYPPQDDLQLENTRLRNREQQLDSRVRHLEAEQQRHMEESLHLRKEMDRNRQDLARNDSTHREVTRQLSVKESEVAELNERLRVAQEQLEAEVKNKNKLR